MKLKFKSFFSRCIWILPLIVVTIGIFYFINLFERLYSRDLNRQISENNQLLTLTETLSNIKDVEKTILTLDTFDNTYTYMLHDNNDPLSSDAKAEIYHSANCPFLLKAHPYESKEIKEAIITKKRGLFITKEKRHNKIIWEFRHFKVKNEKLLVIAGVSNYPKDPIDKELEIAIGIMLFITGLLNYALVGWAKYLHSGSCLIKKK